MIVPFAPAFFRQGIWLNNKNFKNTETEWEYQ